MGAEGSRMYSPNYDGDELFYRGYIQGDPVVPEGPSSREPATSTIVDIYNALGPDMNAISKLAAIHSQEETTGSDTEAEQEQITLEEFSNAISTAETDKHLKEILWNKYNIPSQFIFMAVYEALKYNKLDMLGRALRMNSLLPSDSLLRIDDELMLMHLHKSVTMNEMDAFRLLLPRIKEPAQYQTMTELQTLAIVAAQLGNMAAVQLLCLNYSFCLKQTKQGKSVIIEVARTKSQDSGGTVSSVFIDILELGANFVNTQEPDGTTALHVVTERGDFEAIKVLLSYGACATIPNTQGKTALDIAKETETDKEIIVLLQQVATKLLPAESSLYHAAIGNDFDNVKKLLEKGLSIDSKWLHGKTALAAAAAVGNNEMVNFLLSLGASPIPLGCFLPDLPAMVAMLNGHAEIAFRLMQSTEDYFLKATSHEKKHIKMQMVSLLHHCCRVGATQVANMVLNSRARIDPNSEFRRHHAPIHLAAKYGQLSMVKVLISHQADPTLCTEIYSNTALHYACFYGHLDVAKYLLRQPRVFLNCRNIQHETPLYCVLRCQLTPYEKNSYIREDSVIFLISAGALLIKPGRHKCELKELNLQIAEQRWKFLPAQTIKLLLVLRDEGRNSSLAGEARLTIRGGIRTQVNEESVSQLGLPYRLQHYILLKDWFSS